MKNVFNHECILAPTQNLLILITKAFNPHNHHRKFYLGALYHILHLAEKRNFKDKQAFLNFFQTLSHNHNSNHETYTTYTHKWLQKLLAYVDMEEISTFQDRV